MSYKPCEIGQKPVCKPEFFDICFMYYSDKVHKKFRKEIYSVNRDKNTQRGLNG